nr:location of vulva defective 1 [Bactrocera oleae]
MKLLTIFVFVLLTGIVAVSTEVLEGTGNSTDTTGEPTTTIVTAISDSSDTTTTASSEPITVTREPTALTTDETTSVTSSVTTTSASSEPTTVTGEPTALTTDETTSVTSSETTTSASSEPTTVTGEPTTVTPNETTSVAPSENPTTVPSDTTTVAASETTPNTSETSTNATTNSSGETTTLATEETTDSTSGSTETPDTTPVENNSTNSPATEAPPANKLQCYACEGDDCDEKTVINCPNDGRAYDVEDINKSLSENAAEILLQNYRSVSRLELADVKGFACYRVQIPVNDDRTLKLGCIAIPYGQSACEAVRNELNITATDNSDECVACQTDLCNGSAITKLSVLALLSVLLAKFLF